MGAKAKFTARCVSTLCSSVSFWVLLLTFAVLALNPIPECFHCEFPNAWGRDDAAYIRDSNFLAIWLLGASFLSGSAGIRLSGLVPLGILFAHVATQPIGGVALWSVWSNEGPAIILFGAPYAMASLLAGHSARHAMSWIRRRWGQS